MDGNFTADHIKMRHPEEDVCLTDGFGCMVGKERYQQHLSKALEPKEVLLSPICLASVEKMTLYFTQRSTCHNHRAVNAANMHRNALESTGIGACACARHGCFVPHSVVDFQKGERYVKLNAARCPVPMIWKGR